VLRAVNVVCGEAAVLLGDAESQSRLNIEISIVRNSLLGKSKDQVSLKVRTNNFAPDYSTARQGPYGSVGQAVSLSSNPSMPPYEMGAAIEERDRLTACPT